MTAFVSFYFHEVDPSFEVEFVPITSLIFIVFFVVVPMSWLMFLGQSKNVAEVIPRSFRRVKTIDWIVAVVISCAVIYMIIESL